MRSQAAKRDSNEREIIDALEAMGCSVTQLSQPGVPDLLIGVAYHNLLLEVKSPGESLTPQQRVWHNAWHGTAHVVWTVAEAIEIVGHYIKKGPPCHAKPIKQSSTTKS